MHPSQRDFSNQEFCLLNSASDSGFDSKDEGASAATPTKDPPPPSSANLSLPPNPDLNLPPSNPSVAERPSGGGEDSSSPEVGSGEMSRRAAIRQPVLRKRRMNFN